MRYSVRLLALLSFALGAFGEEGVFVPWEEFREMYRERIERELTERDEEPPFRFAIDDARYQLDVEEDTAVGKAVLSGRVISGEPEAIPLFGPEVVIAGIEESSGGALLISADRQGIAFLPETDAASFGVTMSFLVRPQEDNESQTVSFGIPHALRTALALTLPPKSKLLEAPGIADESGVYHLPGTSQVSVKYLAEESLAATTVIEVDTMSRISVQKGHVFVTTAFHPVRNLPDSLLLQAPLGAKYIASSLKASEIRSMGDDRYEIRLPKNDRPFTVEFALDAFTDGDTSTLTLPRIEGNSGQQGRFVVEEPDDGQVSVAAAGLVSRVPVSRLGDRFAEQARAHRFFSSVPAVSPLKLTLKRFEPIASPAMVLEKQQFFSSFEENGNILSVLIVDVSPEVGPRLKLDAVPDAEIWSLTVNGAKKKVYAGEEGSWIVPLDPGKESHVELAFLTTGPKLGLQGRLEAIVPKSGLPSQHVTVGVALPARIDLLSMEGPVNPSPGAKVEAPTGFEGKPYYFTRSFYDGEGMDLAILYKEPVEQRRGAAQ